MILTRFAPSPTGYLHLGHVVNAIYVWGIAKARDGKVLLRIEDHDRIRCRPEYEQAMIEDLAWLGFVPDAGPVRQSNRDYTAALRQLAQSHHVYVCDCSRKDLVGDGEERRYPGHCRERGLADVGRVGLRVEIAPGEESFDDELLGRRVQKPAGQCGDLLLRDRDRHWTYQFAAVVDDIRDEVSLVIRGVDLLSSTGRQIRLARMLGRSTPPRFAHHPLIVNPGGEKLSKANRDTGIRELREAGVTAADVIGKAAALAGLLSVPRAVNAAHVGELFLKP